ncbi:MAG: DUF3810 domain-containing protein [Bacillota bacterium]|nr:DUF3810 domain-containing protein [Bacillota bacterium]
MKTSILNYKTEIIQTAAAAAVSVIYMIILTICKSSSRIVENIFVPIANYLSIPLKTVFGIFPFSVFEWFILLLLPIAALIVFLFYRKYKNMSTLHFTLRAITTVLLIAVICYLIYGLLFGFAGYRLSMAQSVFGSEPKPDAQKLYETSVYMALKASETREAAASEKFDFSKISSELKKDYLKDSKNYSFLKLPVSNPKKVIFSKAMSYTDITGIYFPVTAEANVNTNDLDFNLPFTMAHEMAHSAMVTREAEANFTAFLICSDSDDPLIRYSAYVNALTYSMNALYDTDKDKFNKLIPYISTGVIEDLRAQNNHWAKYNGVVADVSQKINDAHIKISGQPAGVASYGKVTDLLIEWYSNRKS